jgi:hypothetical protein
VIAAERTFWEKALILHGIYCGYRDEKRRPGKNNLISRHDYGVAMMRDRPEGSKAAGDMALMDAVRERKLLLYTRKWEKLEETKPVSLRVTLQDERQAARAKNYEAMSRLMFGKAPDFKWALGEIAKLSQGLI